MNAIWENVMRDQMRITFWDVQHGHATHVKTPYVNCMGRERHVIIDLGTGIDRNTSGSFNPVSFLNEQINEELWFDCLIITHPHKDHINEIDQLPILPKTMCRVRHITEQELEKLLEPPTQKLQAYLKMSREYRYPVEPKNMLEDPENWGGVEFKIFRPTTCDKSKLNNHSIVTVVKFGDDKVIISGDNEKESLQELLNMDGFPEAIANSFALLAPHHGREAGYCSDFLNIANPRITVVSDRPNTDTSAADRYSQRSSSFPVFHSKTEKWENRSCLSTRNDGHISMIFFGDSTEPRVETW